MEIGVQMTADQLVSWLVANGVTQSVAQEIVDEGVVTNIENAEAILPELRG